jgi:hypothetical protein
MFQDTDYRETVLKSCTVEQWDGKQWVERRLEWDGEKYVEVKQ